MTTAPAIGYLLLCGAAGAIAVEAQQMPDAVEKYGILGLLYIVLLAVATFWLKMGASMVGAIERNTAAVTSLTTEIKLLVQQHDNQAEQDRLQIDVNTQRVLTAIDEVDTKIKDAIANRRGRGNGG